MCEVVCEIEFQSAERRNLYSLGLFLKGGNLKNGPIKIVKCSQKADRYVKGKQVYEHVNNKEKPKVNTEGQRRIRCGVVSLDGALISNTTTWRRCFYINHTLWLR